jgi:acetyl-CoA acetyltransferase
MRRPRDAIAFIGVGGSEIVRRADRGIADFARDAAVAAIADAGLSVHDIDGYVGAPTSTATGASHVDGVDEVWVGSVAKSLEIGKLRWAVDLHRGFSTDMAIAAAHALHSKACRYVLGVRALYNLPAVRPAQEQPAIGARFAARASAYLSRTDATRRDLYEVVALARRNAARNPIAVWRDRSVSFDEYMAAPMIADPLCRFDCDMPVCAAGAFVMARGADIPAGANQLAWLLGTSGGQRPELVFENADLKPREIECAQLYDGFSSMLFEFLESFGFAAADSGWKFVREGCVDREGHLPVNTFGGSLGEGRLHGMGHVREAILQVSGRAGARQLAHAANCLVQVGPFDNSSCLIVGCDP